MDRPPRKYQPLADYLAAQTGEEVTLTFADIERIIGAPLPSSAGTRGFWKDTRGQHNHLFYAWQGVGWQAVIADLRQHQVTFQRSTAETPPTPATPHIRERPLVGGWFWPGRARSE